MATTKTELLINGSIVATKTAAPFLPFNFDTTGYSGAITVAVREYIDGVEAGTTPVVNGTVTVSSTPYEFFGLRKHNPSYAGAAIAVKADGFTELNDIGFDANGELDTAAIAALSGSARFRIAKIYGQYNAQVLEQTVESNMPDIMNAGVAISFDGEVSAIFSSTSNQLKGPTTLTAENGLTAIIVAGTTGNFSASNKGLFGKWGTTAEYLMMLRHFSAPNDMSISSKDSSDVQTSSQSGITPTANQLFIASGVWGATDQYIKTNGVERKRDAISGVRAGTNPFVLGGYSQGGTTTEEETAFREILIYKSEVDPATDETEINAKYGIY